MKYGWEHSLVCNELCFYLYQIGTDLDIVSKYMYRHICPSKITDEHSSIKFFLIFEW